MSLGTKILDRYVFSVDLDENTVISLCGDEELEILSVKYKRNVDLIENKEDYNLVFSILIKLQGDNYGSYLPRTFSIPIMDPDLWQECTDKKCKIADYDIDLQEKKLIFILTTKEEDDCDG